VPASASPGPVVLPPCGHPGSPGRRTPIRTSKALGSMPRPSSRTLSCLAASGVPQSTETAGSPGGPPFLLAGTALQPSGLHAALHGAVCHSLLPGSRIPYPRLRNPHSRDAAGRAGTVASHEPCPASPLVSCPERSGNRLGRAPSCSQTLDTAAVSLASVPARHSRLLSHRQSPQLFWQPSWPLYSSSSHLGPQLSSHSVDLHSAAARRTPPNTSRPRLPLTSAMWVASSCSQAAVPLAQ
jgi:hypothetical protein